MVWVGDLALWLIGNDLFRFRFLSLPISLNLSLCLSLYIYLYMMFRTIAPPGETCFRKMTLHFEPKPIVLPISNHRTQTAFLNYLIGHILF
jgi:hypothetical protein